MTKTFTCSLLKTVTIKTYDNLTKPKDASCNNNKKRMSLSLSSINAEGSISHDVVHKLYEWRFFFSLWSMKVLKVLLHLNLLVSPQRLCLSYKY